MKLLIVRLGALGDIVHTVPAAAALRRACPGARIDWVVDARHASFAELVTCIDRVVPLEKPTLGAWLQLVRTLRPARYDVALDFQGLMKSALIARASGAHRVAGFSIWHLREKGARPFYSEVGDGEPAAHVIQKNLSLLSVAGINSTEVEFPLAHSRSVVVETVRAEASGRPIALINPGAAWPNKRWPAKKFAALAAALHGHTGLRSLVTWGPSEKALADTIVGASEGAASLAPATSVSDLAVLMRQAALVVSGDTGPLHIAAAMGTPLIGLYGPTWPERNGPWDPDDVVISRANVCVCHHKRQCLRGAPCINDITLEEVVAVAEKRLAQTWTR